VIAHLSGTLLEKHVQRIVVDVGGVGYDVAVPLSTFYTVGEPGARVALRIHTHVREDQLQLFGFGTALELTLFERLISVSGIGPKVALSVLSGIEPEQLVRAIRSGDVARLVKIPGVGKKTAERLVVELRDRLPEVAAAWTTSCAPTSCRRSAIWGIRGRRWRRPWTKCSTPRIRACSRRC
jgi:Holliday junction DNA helicase RuvA